MSVTIEELEQHLRVVAEEMDQAWQTPGYRVTRTEWAAALLRRQAGQDELQRGGYSAASEWPDAFWDTVEARYFRAKRALKLAQFGLADDPGPYMITVKDQPERLGVFIIAQYRDRLAGLDPTQWLDAIFLDDEAAERTEVYRALHFPAKAVAAWKAKRIAHGLPASLTSAEFEASAVDRNAIRNEFFRLRKARIATFPSDEAWKVASRRPLSREHVAALLTRLTDSPVVPEPSVISQLREIDLDSLTPRQAVEALRRLQERAGGPVVTIKQDSPPASP